MSAGRLQRKLYGSAECGLEAGHTTEQESSDKEKMEPIEQADEKTPFPILRSQGTLQSESVKDVSLLAVLGYRFKHFSDGLQRTLTIFFCSNIGASEM